MCVSVFLCMCVYVCDYVYLSWTNRIGLANCKLHHQYDKQCDDFAKATQPQQQQSDRNNKNALIRLDNLEEKLN